MYCSHFIVDQTFVISPNYFPVHILKDIIELQDKVSYVLYIQ